YEVCAEAAAWLRARLREPPRVALVCGSGLGALAQELTEPQIFDYADIPHFPRSTGTGGTGSAGRGRFGGFGGVVVPVRALALVGVHTLVLTNAAGSLRPHFGPGHLLVIRDHIDFPGLAGRSPLVGPNDERSVWPRGAGLGRAYDPGLRRLALALAPKELRARPGVYVGVGGPSYETPAECRLLRRLGADAVGMSTVSEASAARHLGLRVLGLSLITN
ncbi:PNPH phosphorylase, partial [Rhagologus leucostigma]|nr:PNPH phosphorylase [Rhagologus leucostigma]